MWFWKPQWPQLSQQTRYNKYTNIVFMTWSSMFLFVIANLLCTLRYGWPCIRNWLSLRKEIVLCTYLWRQINKLLQLASQWPLRLHLWYGLILLTRLCIHCKEKRKPIIIRRHKVFYQGVIDGWAGWSIAHPVWVSLVMRWR